MKFELNQKTVGALLAGFSWVLLFVLVLIKVNVDTEQAFLCKFVETNPDLSMDGCPAHGSNISWLLLAGFIASFLVLVCGLYLFFAHRKAVAPVATGRKEVDALLLSGEEKRIYDLLVSREGSAYQSDLIATTALSKVKISRVLDKLEGRGIIERKRRGMTNIVVLK